MVRSGAGGKNGPLGTTVTFMRTRRERLPMFDTVVLAVDGSESGRRAIAVGLDIADRFDATVHALSVVDEGEIEGSPEGVAADMASALEETAQAAVESVGDAAGGGVTTAVRRGHPAPTICSYATEVEADVIVMGTRGRHGENRSLLGSVAERVLRSASVPVLTARQLVS